MDSRKARAAASSVLDPSLSVFFFFIAIHQSSIYNNNNKANMSTSTNHNNLDIEKAVVEQPSLVRVGAAAVENQLVTPVTSPSKLSKRCCLVVTVTFTLFVALVIGLSVGLSNRHNNNNKQNAASAMTLEELCGSSMMETSCQTVCENAMCCFDDNDETLMNYCVVSLANECDLYEPCRVFLVKDTKGYSLPGSESQEFSGLPPTVQVETICNSEYGQVSDITCEEACWEANCCYWTGEDSCYEEYAAICDEWKAAGCFSFSDPFSAETTSTSNSTTNGGGFSIPGGIELEDGEILQEPDQEVYDICGSTNNAAVTDITCEEACAKAACCYWTGEDSCYNDFSVTCDVWREAGCFVFSVQHEQEVP
jgi:hypothetical protein